MTNNQLDLTPDLPSTLHALDTLIEGELQRQIDEAVAAARGMLAASQEAFGWHFIDLRSIRAPDGIRSGAVFVLPAGSAPPGHRHPNSTQHMRVLAGQAIVMLRLTEGGARHDPSRYSVGEHRPWLVIPQDVVHQFEVSSEHDLVVLSFHTVSQTELLEVGSAGERTYTSPDDSA